MKGGLLPQLRLYTNSALFRHIVMVLILASAGILLFTANATAANHNTKWRPDEWMKQAEWFLVIMFLGEMNVKVLAHGLLGYIKTPWCIFDATVAILSGIGLLMELLHEHMSEGTERGSVALRLAKAARVVRLVRTISRVHRFKVIISSSNKFFPVLPKFLLLLACITYVYAIIGMEAFGVHWGGTSRWAEATADTEYAGQEYISYHDGVPTSTQAYTKHLNFHTVSNAVMTLGSLTMVNNWHILHDALQVAMGGGTDAASETLDNLHIRWGVSIYCVSYHVLTVIVFMNLLICILLQSFLTEYARATTVEKKKKKFEDDEETIPICYSCGSRLTWLNRPSTCKWSRKVCCKKCTVKVIEPRLDGERTGLRVGYNPVRLEKETRKELLETWRQDALFRQNALPELPSSPMHKAAKKKKLVLNRASGGNSAELGILREQEGKVLSAELKDEIGRERALSLTEELHRADLDEANPNPSAV